VVPCLRDSITAAQLDEACQTVLKLVPRRRSSEVINSAACIAPLSVEANQSHHVSRGG
jgi:hypothetical protein